MKRVNKIENLNGVYFRTEEGEMFKYLEEKILSKNIKEIHGKQYNCIRFNDGYELTYRNTELCTFYELKEYEMTEEDEVLSNIIEENSIKVDLYDKNLVKAFLIENDNYEIFGFVDDTDVAYIPFRPHQHSEFCYVCEYREISKFVTNEKDIDGKLLFLIDGIDYRLKTEYDEDDKIFKFSTMVDGLITRYEFDKKSCDMIVKVDDKIGFVNQNKVYYMKEYTIGFFKFKTLIVEDFNSDMSIIYKRYVSNKKTKGITDLRFEDDMFGFFK